MSIEDLLKQLEAEREKLAIEYHNLYEKVAEANRAIKRFYEYEEPFLTPKEVPLELADDYRTYGELYAAAICEHNRILDVINVIKERVGG